MRMSDWSSDVCSSDLAQDANLKAAQAQGLTAVDLAKPAPRPTSTPAPEQDVPVVAPPAAKADQADAAPQRVAEPTVPEVAPAAMVINRPLRSGQRIYARTTDQIGSASCRERVCQYV